MNFWTTLTQKGYFRYKQEENENHHGTSNTQNYLGSKFQHQQTILIFETNFPEKRILPVENIKSEHHHWILLILIGVTIKFQRKLTN